MGEIIVACVMFAFSVASFVISIRSFLEKGFLLNNAYLGASQKERETMDKKSHYRQSAVVFLLVGLIFLLNGFTVLLDAFWISYLVMALACAVIAACVLWMRRMAHSSETMEA